MNELLARLDKPGRVGHDLAVLCEDAAAALRATIAQRDDMVRLIRRFDDGWRADKYDNGPSIWNGYEDDEPMTSGEVAALQYARQADQLGSYDAT